MTEIRSYEQANEYLGKKNSRPIRYKTRVNRRGENIAITHHDTDIITYCDLGINKNFENECMVIIDTQGYHTKTTKDRLNTYLPEGWHIYQEDSIWYLHYWEWGPDLDPVLYLDGVVISPDSSITGAGSLLDICATKNLNKEILKYSRDYIKALFAGEVGKPSNGDCWDCLLRTQTGQTMGGMGKGRHLKSHFEEKYYVPSLLVRAIEVFPVSKAAGWALGDFWGHGKVKETPIWFYNVAKQQLRSSLKRYLRRQLGLAS